VNLIKNTMASIITGLFKSQSQSQKISEDLENAGFSNTNFIIYRHDNHISKEVKTKIWQSFFKDNRKLEDESLVVSVKVKELDSHEKIKQIFNENDAIHQNYIENIKFKDAKSLQFLKRIVSVRAKSLIYASLEIKHHGQTKGINSEVFFGKK
jgi:hypothetical protein